MHKIAKGLKKKKKGKKSKHKKDEELFKPEELEAYRREHSGASEGASGQNEEWKKFISLTSGVDDILKKTQDDLDRIKSTSFFQRIPPPSETQKEKRVEYLQKEAHDQTDGAAAAAKEDDSRQFGIVEVSETESEEDDDDVFDTAYIDAIAAGEVKLAYIPESPTDKQDGDDPFDTSIAERAILGPAVERKGKKLVPLGAAVEVLTGRVQLPTCALKSVPSRRQILKEKNLLLGSFDSVPEPTGSDSKSTEYTEKIKTLLDDDDIPLPDEPIDLSKTLYIPLPQPVKHIAQKTQKIVSEFEDEDDKEFEALAAESLTKPVTSVLPNELVIASVKVGVVEDTGDWKPFENDKQTDDHDLEVDNFEDDPFDTTFAENIVPGKAELKLIEKEVLENDVDFNPRATPDEKSDKIKSVLLADRVPESKLNLIKPVHRDLLGGSTSDLSKLGDKPIQPTEDPKPEEIKYCDPFDTSLVDTAKQPGQAELKFLEQEFLGDVIGRRDETVATFIEPGATKKENSFDDENFDPRCLESTWKERTLSRPDVLNVLPAKSVSFAVPSTQKDLLGLEDTSKISKPLTPFYVRKNSVPGTDSFKDVDDEPVKDPFDTSFVSDLAPGRAELKIIESELFDPLIEKNLSLEDTDFDPRDERKIAKVAAVEAIKDISQHRVKPVVLPVKKEPVDLLSAGNDISVKVLTPAAKFEESASLSYADPFDTSIATNILPGKTELKLLENELIQVEVGAVEIHRDLLVHSGDTIIEKPLSPEPGDNFAIEDDNFDPFDTSIASNIQPGRAELKVLESELI